MFGRPAKNPENHYVCSSLWSSKWHTLHTSALLILYLCVCVCVCVCVCGKFAYIVKTKRPQEENKTLNHLYCRNQTSFRGQKLLTVPHLYSKTDMCVCARVHRTYGNLGF